MKFSYTPTVTSAEEAEAELRKAASTPSRIEQIRRLTEDRRRQATMYEGVIIQMHRDEIASREALITRFVDEIEERKGAIAFLEAHNA